MRRTLTPGILSTSSAATSPSVSRHDEDLRIAVVEDVRDLVGIEVGVDAREEEPRPLRRPTRLEVLDAVLHQHGDVISEPEARVAEELGEPVRPVVQLAVGHGLARVPP